MGVHWRNAGRNQSPVAVDGSRVARRRATASLIRATTLFASLWVLFAVWGPTACAATGHAFLSHLTEAPPGQALGDPVAVTADHKSGDVFVGDNGTKTVDVFTLNGEFVTRVAEGLAPTAIAVNEKNGEVYVAESSADVVVVFKPDGSGGYQKLSEWSGTNTPEGEFGEVSGVAIDNSNGARAGDVYVVDQLNNVVDTFAPKPEGSEEGNEGTFVEPLKGPALEAPNGVAANGATGQVYVADSALGVVDIYNASGAFERKVNGAGSPNGKFSGPEGEDEGNVAAVGIEDASGDIYVSEAERHLVSQFDPEGTWIGQITDTSVGPLSEPAGVAVASNGDVYVAEPTQAEVDVFGPNVVVPDAKTTVAKPAKVTASLSGVINGDGKAAKYHFQWGQSEALGQETPPQSAGTGEEQVSSEVAGLKPSTSYFFRVVAENENGVNYGLTREFTTQQAVDDLSTGPAQNIQPTEATLSGTLDPKGTDAHYYFLWGPTTSYGSSSPEPPADAGSGNAAVAAKTLITHLQPNTTYHYRLVGDNEFGSTEGEDARFTTSGPPRITSEATTVEGHEAATIHARVDPDQLETKYHIEYGETASYGHELPVGTIPAGEAPVAVAATLSGLKIGTTYHYRVVASNSAGETAGPDEIFTTVPSAPIESEFSTEVLASEAMLNTQINPLGHATSYVFQYGTENCGEQPGSCTTLPNPPGNIGSGETGVTASVRLAGLKPATTYHYRVVASNSLGTTDGTEQVFTTQEAEHPFTLADGRAWEMVSPPDKHGAPIEALTKEGGLALAAEDGDSITYVADGSIAEEPEGNRSPEMQQVLSTRTSEGWSSQDIATPNIRAEGIATGSAPEYRFFSPDLSLALVEPAGREPPLLSPEATQNTMYLRDNATDTYLPLVTGANAPPGTSFGEHLRFLGATPDLSHVVFHSTVALTQSPSGAGLYEWSGGRLTLVSLLPGGATLGHEPELGYYNVAARAISNDGSRVIFTTPSSEAFRGHLYMRDTLGEGQTIQLDAAQGVPEPVGGGSAQFQTASSDGSRVFFTDKQRLTADSTAEPAEGEAAKADLYECEVVEAAGKLTCHLKDLTVDHSEGEHAAVQGLLFGASEDGGSVYLVAQGVLAENENGNRETAQAGKDNLYALQETNGEWKTGFIAQLSNEDAPEWEGGKLADTAFLTARVSPNGRYLAFMSAASPTGYDNIDQRSGKQDEEVYLYDSETHALSCASCNPTGARPSGVLDTLEAGEGVGLLVDRRKIWAELGHEHWLAGSIPGWTAQSDETALFQSRYLSDSGRLFFDSPDHLVPQAKNGKENVYEYEPAGVGSCQSPSGACLSLMSSGSSDRESAFLEATPSGDDVFFLTAAQLVPQDTDTAFDVYDARTCTPQSPCASPQEAPPAGCSITNACRPAPPAQQAPLGPSGTATSTVAGVNPAHPKPPGAVKSGEPKPQTRAQKLARALKACKKIKAKRRRQACERKARRAYGARHMAGKAQPARRRSR
jgi:DNA-binding beta-propeller fold protein YncE